MKKYLRGLITGSLTTWMIIGILSVEGGNVLNISFTQIILIILTHLMLFATVCIIREHD